MNVWAHTPIYTLTTPSSRIFEETANQIKIILPYICITHMVKKKKIITANWLAFKHCFFYGNSIPIIKSKMRSILLLKL